MQAQHSTLLPPQSETCAPSVSPKQIAAVLSVPESHDGHFPTLQAGNLRAQVMQPPGEHTVSWLSRCANDCFRDISALCELTIQGWVNCYSLPGEGFPPGFEYRWVDATSSHDQRVQPKARILAGKPRAMRVSAAEYVLLVLAWAEEETQGLSTAAAMLAEKQYPGTRMSDNFSTLQREQERAQIQAEEAHPGVGVASSDLLALATVRSGDSQGRTSADELDVEAILKQEALRKRIREFFKRLFRVYAILYHTQMELFRELDAERHLNTCFKHLMFCSLEFGLVGEADLEALPAQVEHCRKEFSGLFDSVNRMLFPRRSDIFQTTAPPRPNLDSTLLST